MAAEKLEEKISMSKAFDLMAQFTDEQKFSLYLDSENYREAKLVSASKNILSLSLRLMSGQLSDFQVGKSYNFAFEFKGKNYTGSLMIDESNDVLKAHLLRDLNVFQRREDFRVRPPDIESYYIIVLGIGSVSVNIKLNFVDLSHGGMKMTLIESKKINFFKSESRIKGNLICKDDVIEFSGIIKKPTVNSIGVQFDDLSADSKNQIWREVMRWSRSFSKYR